MINYVRKKHFASHDANHKAKTRVPSHGDKQAAKSG